MTSYPAPWWPELVGQVTQIVHESGIREGFHAETWLLDFLTSPSPALGNRTPLSLMETDEGRGQVRTLIAQMQSGAYA